VVRSSVTVPTTFRTLILMMTRNDRIAIIIRWNLRLERGSLRTPTIGRRQFNSSLFRSPTSHFERAETRGGTRPGKPVNSSVSSNVRKKRGRSSYTNHDVKSSSSSFEADPLTSPSSFLISPTFNFSFPTHPLLVDSAIGRDASPIARQSRGPDLWRPPSFSPQVIVTRWHFTGTSSRSAGGGADAIINADDSLQVVLSHGMIG